MDSLEDSSAEPIDEHAGLAKRIDLHPLSDRIF